MEAAKPLNNLTSERIDAFFSATPWSHPEVDFRRTLLSRAQTLPAVLQYGLGMNAEYPVIEQLLHGTHTDVRHDLKLLGDTALHPLPTDPDERSKLFGLLTREATTFYDALLSGVWKQSVVVEFTGTGTLHLSSTYDGVHAELIVIHVHPGATGTVIEELKGETNVVAGRTIVAIVDEGGMLDYRSRLAPLAQGTFFLRQYGIVKRSATLSWYDVSRSSADVFSRTMSDLAEEGASSNIYLTACSDGPRVLDVEHRMMHSASHTHAHIASAGVGKGTSRTIYRGDIIVDKGTVGANGKQEGRFLVLEPTAKIDAVPALDVSAHDVKSSHAFSVGYLSPAMLFYPRLRGLRKEDAVGFLVSGMMKKTLSRGGASEVDAYQMSRIGENL